MVPEVKSDIVFVTPQLAREYLTANQRNRPLSKRRIIDLVEAMDKGEWRYTDESIKFDTEGRLLDGQHRLTAILESSKPQWLRVTSGLDTASFEVLDRGKRRSPADVLAMHGIKHYSACAAAAVWIDRLTSMNGKKRKTQMSSIEVLEYMGMFPVIPKMVNCIMGSQAHRIMKSTGLPTAVGVIASGGTEPVQEKVKGFFVRLGEGVHLTKNDPIHVLRKRLERDIDRLSLEERAIGLIKTWNAYMEGKKTSRVSVVLVKHRGESFPTVISAGR